MSSVIRKICAKRKRYLQKKGVRCWWSKGLNSWVREVKIKLEVGEDG